AHMQRRRLLPSRLTIHHQLDFVALIGDGYLLNIFSIEEPRPVFLRFALAGHDPRTDLDRLIRRNLHSALFQRSTDGRFRRALLFASELNIETDLRAWL